MKYLRDYATRLIMGANGLLLMHLAVQLFLSVVLAGTAFFRRDSSSPYFNGNIYFWLVTHWEPAGCAVWTALVVVLALILRNGGNSSTAKEIRFGFITGASVWILAAVVTALGCAGWFWVLHAYPLSMDEVMAQFQAQIFAEGRICAPVPAEHAKNAWALTPLLCTLREDGGPYGSWVSTYLPGWSLILTPFEAAGAPWLANPLISSLCLPVLLSVARRIWPASRAPEPALAVLLLVSSPQFLTMAMTAYAMPAHLLLSLVWLWLMLRRDWIGWIAAPCIGFFATILHQPHVHALIAAPFLFRLVRERRWAPVAWMTMAYAVQIPVVMDLIAYFHPGQLTGSSGAPIGLDAYSLQLHSNLQPLNALLLVTWNSSPLLILSLLAMPYLIFAKWEALISPQSEDGELAPCEPQDSAALHDSLTACILTFSFYVLMPATQGHGWGYRYFFPAMGCWCLIAAAGLRPALSLWGLSVTRRYILVSCIWAAAVILPYRCAEMSIFTRPFALGFAFLSQPQLPSLTAAPAPAGSREPMLAAPLDVWYGQDYVRNDPFLRHGPVVLFTSRLGQAQLLSLLESGALAEPDLEELKALGLRHIRPNWKP